MVDLTAPHNVTLYVAGLQKKPSTHSIGAPSHLLGARLLPMAALKLLGPQLAQAPAGWTPLATFLGQDAGKLAQQLAATRNTPQSIAVLTDFLRPRLLSPSQPSQLDAALNLCLTCQGQLTVTALAHHAASTERSLRRAFGSQLGMSPKHFLRIIRFQAALQHGPSHTNHALLASHYGYADQSHLSREIKILSGDTPSTLLSRPGAPELAKAIAARHR